jgi:hypothetical protein
MSMELLRRMLAPWRARQAAEAESDLRGWYEACEVVLVTAIQGLQDPKVPRGDIGVSLDRIDRALFRLRDCGTGAQRALRRRDPGLGERMRRLSESVVEMRNDTVRFLIRAQGATPPFMQGEGDSSRQAEAYQQAMLDFGQAARQRSAGIERDLRRLWADLQPTLAELAGLSTSG